MFEPYSELAERALRDEAPSAERCLWILDSEEVELLPLLHAAFAPRRQHFGRRVGVQVLNNLQNGLCPEDCGYCAQSKISQAAIRPYPIKSDDEIFADAERAARAGASRYCMALSGRGPSVARTRKLADLIERLKSEHEIEFCLSAGIMGALQTQLLADAGLDRLNHNLNTSEDHYDEICTTHTYAERIATLASARQAGIELCSGMIVGMGESSHDIVEVAFKLRELEIESIPVNFLIPIDGNPVSDDGSLTPERCLRALCLMRLVNPRAEIRVAGGREGNLRGMQSLALYPANSLFVGGYLTTRGEAMEETFAMIEDAGFEVADVVGQRSNDEIGEGQAGVLKRRGGARGTFRLPGNDAPLLRPDTARPEA